MALANLNRAQDTQVPTNMLSTIVPKDFPTLPLPVASMTDANPNAGKPRYSTMADWQGGLRGDDVDVATATTQAIGQNNNPVANYTPRNQAQKAAMMVPPVTLAVDVARARGWIAPGQSYIPGTIPAAPVITSLSPNTAVAGSGAALVVDIVGTGFTVWSTVLSGNYPIPSEFISPTLIRIMQFPKNSVAGTVQVVVIDHDVNSAPSDFVFT